jgi:hypothetical protein
VGDWFYLPMITKPYISIGYKKGEMDFSISCSVCDLSLAEMNRLRQIIIVAIGTMEDMWRREQELFNMGSKDESNN